MSTKGIKAPPPLAATDRSSFAYKTMKDRLPVILVKTIDFFHRQRKSLHKFGGTIESPNESQLAEIEADAKAFISSLTKIRKDVETNKVTELLEEINLDEELRFFNDDVNIWNTCLEENRLPDGSLPRFFDSPWLLVECYLYRRIKNSILSTKHLKMFDPFVEQKQAAFIAASNQVKTIAQHLVELEKQTRGSTSNTHPSERIEFSFFTRLALWANKSDLSIAGMSADKVESQTLSSFSELRDSIDELQSNILCDNLSELWFKVQAIKDVVRKSTQNDETIYVDLVADNSGYEIFVDLCLIHMLSLILCGADEMKAVKFRIHLKRLPWFVSDAMRPDISWLLNYLQVPDRDPSLKQLGEKWSNFIKRGFWMIEDHKFWTLPHDYASMSNVASDLHCDLKKSSLIIFKGDLNYRKLTGDRKWHILTPFRAALRGFSPAPLVALRTAKADVVVGIEDVNIFAQINNNELPRDWMISGNYGLIQFLDST